MKADLFGASGDETKLLSLPDIGYSMPVPGSPTLVEVSSEQVVVALTDAKATLEFRVGEVPLQPNPEAVAAAIVQHIADARKRPDWAQLASQVPLLQRPASITGAAELRYPVNGTEPLIAEHLWVALRPTANSFQVLYRTIRYAPDDFTTIHWHHLRTSLGGHHQWDPSSLRTTAPSIWPASELALPSLKLELTPAAMEEARAKALEVGTVSMDTVREMIEILDDVANEDFPPHEVLPAFLINMHASRLEQLAPNSRVLTRNIRQLSTAFDLRAWAWQCGWALIHRANA